MLNFDAFAKFITEHWELLATISAILGAGGIGGFLYGGWQNRRKAARLRQLPAGNFPFTVIKPRSPDLLKQIMGGDETDPLADYKIPYQERQRDRSVRQELENAFTEKNWVLILGKSGLGKTREAAHLADVLNQEGWTVLKLADRPEEWLDIPKHFPADISSEDKLLFFLDDLNRWMYAGNPHELYPKAAEELTLPLREPVQERLPKLLKYFKDQSKSVRVIATARNEQEIEEKGELSPWKKLQWEKYNSFWQKFNCYSLGEPSVGAVVSLLTDCVSKFGMQGNSAEYEQIARRNGGTFRNITEYLISAKNRGWVVNNKDFSPKLDETWRQRYNKLVKLYPLAVYVYNAVELLRNLNLLLTVPLLEATTKCLLPGWGLRRWLQEWQLRHTLRYLVDTDNILRPKDGQIEGKKTKAVDLGRYFPAVLQALDKIGKRYPDYPVATECLNCGNALYDRGLYKEAIASYDKALEFKPDLHEAWYNRGNALFVLKNYKEAIKSYDEALKLKPGLYKAWLYRGNALFKLGRYNKAIPSYDQALNIKQDFYEAWSNRGVVLYKLGLYKDAIASFDKALEFKPDDSDTYYNKACCYGLQENTDLAIEALQQAIILDFECRQSAKNESDFDSIRDDERFQTLIRE